MKSIHLPAVHLKADITITTVPSSYLKLPESEDEACRHSDAQEGEADDQCYIGPVILTDKLLRLQGVDGAARHRLRLIAPEVTV